MSDDKKLLEIAFYIIDNKATMKETAEEFEISVRTLQLYLKEMKGYSQIDVENNCWDQILEEIQKIKEENQYYAKIKGGQQGKRQASKTQEEIKEMLDIILRDKLSLREFAEQDDIPKSTIYEMITSYCIDKPELLKKLKDHFNNKLETRHEFMNSNTFKSRS